MRPLGAFTSTISPFFLPISERAIGDAIEINPALAFFIPLIVATAGNIGVQSSAIVVQGLASKDFQFQSIFFLKVV